ncbi:hypothetical protein FT643_05000 [Ketobacter sp. MCCC 1A13808]|uniref:hypothetical protein n=1 Tax=Ketobacter sp. MCCC 1A13808 TaxID=2602738 RepID=UPI000F1126FC|nr:hypothetical protein [Ketobacter sp. MCCC 1A13808]MVF11497.1 hypothetical protein [Ketobacter sp. MCCC 1A13808]RLP53295.1 MAG: hypothetical protein D6160_16760 [Ketobacter sp.]
MIIEAPSVVHKLASDFDKDMLKIAFEFKLKEGKIIWQHQGADGSIEVFHREPYSAWRDRFSLGLMTYCLQSHNCNTASKRSIVAPFSGLNTSKSFINDSSKFISILSHLFCITAYNASAPV